MNNVFIAGCGYIGRRVAWLCRQANAEVTCMIRQVEHAEELKTEGYNVVTCSLDSDHGVVLKGLAGCDLFYMVPPPGGGSRDLRAHNFCRAMEKYGPPARIVYLSATSVYSARDGSVVTEYSPVEPATAMGRRRLDAEAVFSEYAGHFNVPLVILRVSGIYGPGRLPIMQIRQGQPLLREEDSGPSSRIHADDLAAVCCAAAEKGRAGEIFNVSDGRPCSLTSYFNTVADVLGVPRQPQVSLEDARRVMSPLMWAYSIETRVVDNSLMIERFGVPLRYPDHQSGVMASLPEAV